MREEQEVHLRRRKGAVFAEPYHKGYYYKMPFWNKFVAWERDLYEAVKTCHTFKQFQNHELITFVRAMEIHKRFAGEDFAERGEVGDSLFIVLEGTLDCFVGKKLVASCKTGAVLDEVQILFGTPRMQTFKAQDECVCGKLCRVDYVNLTVRLELKKRDDRKAHLRNSKLLEMMGDEQIAQLSDVLFVRIYEAGTDIITQGDENGTEFYILERGEAVVTKKTADDVQEYMRYYGGELFGEIAVMTNAPRAVSITAVLRCEVLVLARAAFERLFGPMKELQAQQYQTDPRKIIADFYETSDDRGPRGTLNRNNQKPDTVRRKESSWFAVYRPTSRDAINKMLSGAAVGKGLNIKGKSAKKGILSGYVPFIQINDNKHKSMIETSPAGSRLKIYYKSKSGRDEALKVLTMIQREMGLDTKIMHAEDYLPEVYGIDLSEALMREAYIMRPDLSPIMGWETGRPSEPAYMDMNLHTMRETSDPSVVLWQFDEADPLNPRGLLVAYAERTVKPVVSDFDTFTVGSRNFKYEMLQRDQADVVSWSLDVTEMILKSLNSDPWITRWLQFMKTAGEKGSYKPPKPPKYGFGDPTSYRLIGDVIAETALCGAVRHGAECCNFACPQELDDQYLVVWHKFPSKPWDYKTEDELRKFLLARVEEGYSFPLNAVWPVRDPGWYQVLQALEKSEAAKPCMLAWYPPEVGILQRIHKLHEEHPKGFRIVDNLPKEQDNHCKTIKVR